MTLTVLCPSFGRPDAARELYETFHATARANTELRFLVWENDETRFEYPPNTSFYPEKKMVARVNGFFPSRRVEFVGWVADDNRFETPAWDYEVFSALRLRSGGVVYGNDVVSPGSKPSHVFMDVRIPNALGWFLLPTLRSTFFDDVWEQIGRGLGTLQYLPQIKVNHLYVEKDNRSDFGKDKEEYERWVRHDLDNDLARIRRALRPRRSPSGREAVAPSSP